MQFHNVDLQVIGAKVVTNARTPGARCYGYVTMATSEDASKCIQHLHRTELHGRMISVERVSSSLSSVLYLMYWMLCTIFGKRFKHLLHCPPFHYTNPLSVSSRKKIYKINYTWDLQALKIAKMHRKGCIFSL